MAKRLSYSGEFSFSGGKPEVLAAGIGATAKAKSAVKPTHILRKHGKESLHTDFASAHKAAHTEPYDPGVSITDMSGKITHRGERYESTVARELSEAWWCGTPEVMEKERKKAPPATTRQPDRAGNWSVNSVDKPVTEASDKVKKASKPKQPKAGKPNRVPDAKNEDPAMIHAQRIMKMAKCVSASVHAEPLDLLAAAHARVTFHPSIIGEEAIDEVNPSDPLQHPYSRDRVAYKINKAREIEKFRNGSKSDKASATSKEIKTAGNVDAIPGRPSVGQAHYTKASNWFGRKAARLRDMGEEAIESIVNKFIEDTMTGDVASMALGFAPTGEMAPHEGHGKKKKKKNQFQKLSDEMSGKGNRANMEDSKGGARSMFSRLARKVAGGMPT